MNNLGLITTLVGRHARVDMVQDKWYKINGTR